MAQHNILAGLDKLAKLAERIEKSFKGIQAASGAIGNSASGTGTGTGRATPATPFHDAINRIMGRTSATPGSPSQQTGIYNGLPGILPVPGEGGMPKVSWTSGYGTSIAGGVVRAIGHVYPTTNDAVRYRLANATAAFSMDASAGSFDQRKTLTANAMKTMTARGTFNGKLDVIEGMNALEANGIGFNNPGWRTNMASVAGISNIMPGIGAGGAAQVLAGFNQAQTVNRMKMVGIQIRDPRTGEMRGADQIAQQFKNFYVRNATAQGVKQKDLVREFQIAQQSGGVVDRWYNSMGLSAEQRDFLNKTTKLQLETGITDLSLANKKQLESVGLTTKDVSSQSKMFSRQQDALASQADSLAAAFRNLNSAVGTLSNAVSKMPGPLSQLNGLLGGQLFGAIGGLLQLIGGYKAAYGGGSIVKASGGLLKKGAGSLLSEMGAGSVGLGAGILAAGVGAFVGGNILQSHANKWKNPVARGAGLIGGNALKWGGAGAMIGSVIPVVGTGLGAGIGAAAGALWGAFKTFKHDDGVATENPLARPLYDKIHKQFPGTTFLGIWGDAAHQKRKSDHNTGDAVDIGFKDMAQGAAIRDQVLRENGVKYAILGWDVYYPNGKISKHGTKFPHFDHVHVSFGNRTGFGSGGGGGAGGGGGGGGAWGNNIVGEAAKQQGRGYTDGDFDCSGFVKQVFQKYGVTLPNTSWEQAKKGTEVKDIKDAQMGDLLFFHFSGGHSSDPSADKINHVAIYAGNMQMIDNAKGQGVRTTSVPVGSLVTIRRVLQTGFSGTKDLMLSSATATSVLSRRFSSSSATAGLTGAAAGAVGADAAGAIAGAKNSKLSAWARGLVPTLTKQFAALGIPASSVMAFAAQLDIETRGGQSDVFKRTNNVAGIGGKGHYRTYNSLEAGLQGYVNLLSTSKNYTAVMDAAKTGDAIATATALGKSPWAAQHYRLGSSGKEGGAAGIVGTEGMSLVAKMGMMDQAKGSQVTSRANGGWNIPQDEFTKAHAGEMILPSRIAEAVRDAIKNGSSGGETKKVEINLKIVGGSPSDAQLVWKTIDDQINRNSMYTKIRKG